MGMVKMKYINIYGSDKDPQEALEVLTQLKCFHPDASVAEPLNSKQSKENKYESLYVKTKGVLQDLNAAADCPKYKGEYYNYDEVCQYVEKFALEVAKRGARKAELQNQVNIYDQAKTQLYHLTGLSTSVDDIFSVQFLKVRFGRLPKDSYAKLAYYEDKQFNFTSYDFDGEYYWGVYFTPAEEVEEADNIFASLYFERIWVPEFVHGTPAEAITKMMAKIGEMNAELKKLCDISDIAAQSDIDALRKMAAWASYNSQIFEMHKYAVILDSSFLISGFIPENKFDAVVEKMKILPYVKVSEDEHEKPPMSPPVKLKNNWFSRPYEMYVSMYGLPSYGDLDPTTFVSITYSILFGIMFGDVGQGILLGLIGFFFMWRKKHMQLGLIITRCSIFSVIFGFVYGSLFGFEEAMNPLYYAIGLAGKPVEIMQSTNLILIASIGFGVVIIAAAILMGIVSKFKRKIIGSTIFSVNGIAGFVFYVSVVLVAVKMLMHIDMPFVGTILFYIICLAVPFLCMYFAEPLSCLVDKKPIHEKPGEIFINGFFEMFDALLTFASNTMSFLRVGGFVLAHAGMMSVVFTLAQMTSGVAYWIIVVIGNLFVMGLEGLFVGIQVLRLEFYEVFSRFLDADGTAFEPLCIKENKD